MSKSILVIDTPENCKYCPLSRMFGIYNAVECKVGSEIVLNRNSEKIPDWCPLQKFPEKLVEEDRWFSRDYAAGWNACIDEHLAV